MKIIEAEACPDYVHILVNVPPKISASSFIGYLKGESSLMIFDRYANLKHKYGNSTVIVNRRFELLYDILPLHQHNHRYLLRVFVEHRCMNNPY